MTTESLTEEDALRAYAKMMHTLSVEPLLPLLHEQFHYESQWNFHEYAAVWCPMEIGTKDDYIKYITPRLQRLKDSGTEVFAEMARLPTGPCVVVAQGNKDDLAGTVLVKVEGGKIRWMELCAVPNPYDAERTGEYPR